MQKLKLDWKCTWTGRRWANSDGGVIAKHWTVGLPVKTIFYLCFDCNDAYQAGINFSTTSTLRDAKMKFNKANQ